MDNNYGGDDRENFQPNGEGGGFENGRGDGDGSENKKPWFLTPTVTVPKEYNPYRDGESVFAETVKASEGAFRGAEQLGNEDPVTFYHRRRWEWGFARMQAKKRLGKSSEYVSALLIAYLFLINFFPLCLYFAFSETVVTVTMTVLQYVLIPMTILLLANIGQKHKVFTFFKKPKASWFFVLKWSVMALGLTYAVSMLSSLFFYAVRLLGVNVNDLAQPIPDSPWMLFLEFFTVVIAAPIFEELIFRGVLLTHHMKYGCWHSIIVTAVLFGLFHQNHRQMFYAMALGVLFGYIDVKSGSIIPSVIAHVTINLYSFLISFSLYFTNYNETLSDPMLGVAGPPLVMMLVGLLDVSVYALMIISVVMLIYEVYKNKSEFQLPKGDSFLTEKERATAFFTHPVTVILLVILAISIYVVSFSPSVTVTV